MPLYEYECLTCGARFEEIQKFSDPPVKKHAGCGGKVRKLLSPPAFQFKGSGWYITDYARAGRSDGDGKAGKDGDGKAEKTAKNETKTESKSSTESKPASSESPKAATTESSKK